VRPLVDDFMQRKEEEFKFTNGLKPVLVDVESVIERLGKMEAH
jgi:hypothetical protein